LQQLVQHGNDNIFVNIHAQRQRLYYQARAEFVDNQAWQKIRFAENQPAILRLRQKALSVSPGSRYPPDKKISIDRLFIT
jgi:hypothetical protein